ncbi:glutathione S-transferase [Cochlodiniinecator piscidefendens]|uniref:glutathione S-transferase n=1 Tax=Cochlodiniinecator piscidefendens TaxID=2715756 RepID=UPI00140D67D3|nr:glutathione S-transferase [Cochlodiniinecator piscidefendens]
MPRPILYSFRRCPYAMRARLAIQSAGVECELREIVLRDKAPELLSASPKGTVPVIIDGDQVIEESFDVMHWALAQNDPEGWLMHTAPDLIAECDGPFKSALDRYKYASRYDDIDASDERAKASTFLQKLNTQLDGKPYLFGGDPSFADMATVTFVRQFAHVDLEWFNAQPWPYLIAWLEAFKASDRFKATMQKYPKWESGDDITMFPAQG